MDRIKALELASYLASDITDYSEISRHSTDKYWTLRTFGDNILASSKDVASKLRLRRIEGKDLNSPITATMVERDADDGTLWLRVIIEFEASEKVDSAAA